MIPEPDETEPTTILWQVHAPEDLEASPELLHLAADHEVALTILHLLPARIAAGPTKGFSMIMLPIILPDDMDPDLFDALHTLTSQMPQIGIYLSRGSSDQALSAADRIHDLVVTSHVVSGDYAPVPPRPSMPVDESPGAPLQLTIQHNTKERTKMKKRKQRVNELCEDLTTGLISGTQFCAGLESEIQRSEVISWEIFAKIGRNLSSYSSDMGSRIWRLADEADSNIQLYFEAEEACH